MEISRENQLTIENHKNHVKILKTKPNFRKLSRKNNWLTVMIKKKKKNIT